MYLGLGSLVIPIIDGDTNVSGGHNQEGKQTEWSKVHLGPVGDHVGEMGGDQSVDTAAAPHQIHERIGDGDNQGSEEDSGEVDQEDPPPSMNHLQGNTQH